MRHVKSKLKLGLGVALTAALVCSLVLVAAPMAASPDTVTKCGCLGAEQSHDEAEWSSTDNKYGDYSALLTKGSGTDGSVHVQFTPDGVLTLDDLATIGDTGLWYKVSDAAKPGPYGELLFEDPDSAGFIEITLNIDPTDTDWTEVVVDPDTSEDFFFQGNTPNEVFFTNDGVKMTLANILAGAGGINDQIVADDSAIAAYSAADWELTRVRAQLWNAGSSNVNFDGVTIDGTTYDIEPCYFLEPDIAKNVKTSDATFTVVDACGTKLSQSNIRNWVVYKGEGAGEVVVIAGGEDTDQFITVRMVTTGDCIITCDVWYPGQDYGEIDATLQAEKKWGEIASTELTAWELDEEGVVTGEHDRAEVEVLEEILIKEEVTASFLPGLVEANAGGAKVTWWLLKDNATSQAAIEALVAKFENSSDPDADLGYGCGQYGDWDDDGFIPEDDINAIYATHKALDTNFVKAEGTDITATTKLETLSDEALEPLGEGLTNTTVKFSEVGDTDEAEPVIVVVLADYPLDKNGENAVCVEYLKFTPLPLVTYKDVQTHIADVIIDPDTGEIDPIHKMLYVFVRDYDGSPATGEAVRFAIDGPYGLFVELLEDTDDPSTASCYESSVDAGIFLGGQSAGSTTRLATTAEIAEFVDLAVDLDYTDVTGYAIAGVKIVSSHCENVDVFIWVHDCYGQDEVVITRDVMVTGFCEVPPPPDDILAYYRAYSGDEEVVETTDLLKAANDWANEVVPPDFTEPINTIQLLTLANEWAATE